MPALSIVPLGAHLEFDGLNAELQNAADDFIAECSLVEPARRYCGADGAGVHVLAFSNLRGPRVSKFLIINGIVFREEAGELNARLDGP